MTEPLIVAEGVTRGFAVRRGLLPWGKPIMAVRGVDLKVARGEAVGVVGESGCGKSTLGRLLLRLLAPTGGRVLFEGQDLATMDKSALRALRRRMQIVFQDPYGSLDPRRSVGEQIADGLRIHNLASGPAVAQAVAGLLVQVGLDPAMASRLPHQFSGGQRQRIAIARALATKPDFLVADEAVSALDVSVQAQIMALLAKLRTDLGLAMVFISHDLHVVRRLCDRVVVMYLGLVVEEGPAETIFRAPAHPYTRALLAATPSLHRTGERPPALGGDVPSVANPPSGCVFRTRCPQAEARCSEAMPPLEAFEGRQVACWRVGEMAAAAD